MKLVRYTGPNDWSALYVDGNLETSGDHNLVDERIAMLCNIEERDGNDFLLGGNSRRDVAATLEEIENYLGEEKSHAIWCAGSHVGPCRRGKITGTEGSPNDLRAEAEALLRRAQEIENE